jgi:hybrid cluster-associated redox disulfide protein
MLHRRTSIGRRQLVDDVMQRWPATIRIFLDFRMDCVGCPIGSFHTIEDACREHRIAIDGFLAKLRAAVTTRRGSAAESAAISNRRRGARRRRTAYADRG